MERKLRKVIQRLDDLVYDQVIIVIVYYTNIELLYYSNTTDLFDLNSRQCHIKRWLNIASIYCQIPAQSCQSHIVG